MFHKRDRFGEWKRPGVAYANFKMARIVHDSRQTWEQAGEAYRKKLRKKKIARLSRRANRGK